MTLADEPEHPNTFGTNPDRRDCANGCLWGAMPGREICAGCIAREGHGLTDYDRFIASKKLTVPEVGFEPDSLPSFLYPFQRNMTATALKRGRAALLAECGMGKTPCQLAWADAVAQNTGRPVLILAPLAVTQQTVREGDKFGIPVRYTTTDDASPGEVVISNYERLEDLGARRYGGVVLDESSILKSYSGAIKSRLLALFAETPFRLACSATPAPNDHLELGNHSEFLSVLSSHQMIARWFINDTSQFGSYRLKGHAVEHFWDWVSGWASMCGLPSDIDPSYSDDGYRLPPLNYHMHTVAVDMIEGRGENLFRIPELSATSVHQERRRTADARAALAAELVHSETSTPWCIWAETDYEADALARLLPEAVNVRGSESLATKERGLLGFADGSVRVLITKPKIAAWGLNWQHCSRMIFVAATFSFESWYQAVRRSWRFGQTNAVDVHMLMGATEHAVLDVLNRKRAEFETMRDAMIAAARRRQHRRAESGDYEPRTRMILPPWLKSEEQRCSL